MTGYVPGQVLGRTVTLGSLRLGVVDAAGVAWRVAAGRLPGWDGPSVRSQYTDREADHGAWAGPTYAGARVITVAGTVVAPDLSALDAAVEQLLAAAAFEDTLLVVGETIPKQTTVRRSGEPLIEYETDRIARYSVLLTSADPWRYSTVLQSGPPVGLPVAGTGISVPLTVPVTIPAGAAAGSIVLTNAGSAPARPAFTVRGPTAGGFTILVTTGTTIRQLTYADSLLAGEQLVIDTDRHTVILGGAVSRRRYLSGQWPQVPAGQTATVTWSCPTYHSAAQLTASLRSAWL
ncbi:hypothetical protein ACFVVU_23715 [Kitasatospora sp. NPDC057965]|uniref:hypothetical protein n=1 Tax=Kitasatospora sp. NPDC057965 TaxID=3346291 RepID=UPI0036DCAA42